MKTISTTALLSFAAGVVMFAMQFAHTEATRTGFMIAAILLVLFGALCYGVIGLNAWSERIKMKESVNQLHLELESFLKSNDTAS